LIALRVIPTLFLSVENSFGGIVVMSAVATRMSTRSERGRNGNGAAPAALLEKKRKAVHADPLGEQMNGKPVKPSARETMSLAQKIISDYNVDPYDYRDEVLEDAVILMFRHYDLFRLFSFEESTMRKFVERVKTYYNPQNLFHNFKHVWGVLHLAYQILIRGADEYLLPMDIYAVMIAALCHDIQHPGNNNAFEVATTSDLSKAKKGIIGAGILECHHATMTYTLLNAKGQDSDILRGFNEEQADHFKRQVSLIILGTDMAKHPSILAEAQAYSKAASTMRATALDSEQQPEQSVSGSSVNGNYSHSVAPHPKGDKGDKPPTPTMRKSVSKYQIAYEDANPLKRDGVDSTDPESRIAFTRVIVHTADIGAQTQTGDVARKWMERCYGEFRSQARKEELLGIVTSPFLHDLKEDYKTYSAQYSFIEETVEPLWGAMSTFLPKLAFAMEQLNQNKLVYKKMLDDYLSAHQKGL
jgi:hypothetical protein